MSDRPDPDDGTSLVAKRMAARSYDEDLDERGRRRIAQGSTVGEIALRAYTEPMGLEPNFPRLDVMAYPNVALLIRLVPVPGTDAPWFGTWGFMSDVRDSGGLTFRGVFYPERLPVGDIEQLRSAAAALGVSPRYVEPWRGFLKRLFRWTHRPGHRVPLVAWRLPEHLGLLAADWVAAPDGGIDLIVWTQPDRRTRKRERRRRKRLRNGEIENPHRPRIHVEEIGGGRARIWFRDRWVPDERDRVPEGETEPVERYQFRGRFVDLADLCYGLSGTVFDSAEDAARAFGTASGSAAHETVSEIGPLLAQAFRELGLEARLYSKLVPEHESRGVPIAPDRVHSPASYGSTIDRAGGLVPPLVRWPEFPREVLAAWMGAFHGGENRIGLLVPPRVALPVTTVDFTGGYVAVWAMIGAHRVHIARRVAIRDIDPEATRRYVERLAARMRRWLEHPTPRPPLTPGDLHRLAFTLVEVIPLRGVLPHRRRNDAGTAWRMQVGPLTHTESVPFVLFDVLRSTLRGRVPEFRSGHRLVPIGTVPGLRPLTLPDGTIVPAGGDVPLELSQFRLRLAARHDLDEAERERLIGWAKLVANAMVSGLPSQVNRRRLHGKHGKVQVWDHLGRKRVVRTEVIEEAGAWFFPPLAAAVTAGQRFFTFLARGLVEAAGGHVPYIATDALGIVSTPDGGWIPCAGGPDLAVDPETGLQVPAFKTLPFAEVEQIREAVEVFSPYPEELRLHRTRWIPRPKMLGPFGLEDRDRRPYPVRVPIPAILKLEKENFDGGASWRHQAHMLARSPMRAYLYKVRRRGMHVEVVPPPQVINDRSIIDLEILKASEQALGQLLPPPGAGQDWIGRAAEHELKLGLGVQDPDPDGWDEPVIAVIPITSPGESRDRRGRARRPWSRVAVLRPHPIFGPRRSDGQPAIPTVTWHEALNWRKERWTDFATGEPITRVHVGHRPFGEQARVLTYAEVARKHFARVPERMLGPDGEPVTGKTLGPLQSMPTTVSIVRLIGREMNLLDRAGITTNPDYSDYTGEHERRGLVLQVLRLAGAPAVSKLSGIPARTVRRFLATGRTSRDRWGTYMEAATVIATKALVSPERALPTNEEASWRLYVKNGRRCRCGAVLRGKQRKWCSACRTSSYRKPGASRSACSQ